MNEKRLILVILFSALSGCAHNQYRAAEIPRKYAAKPVRNYSMVDLTPYATQMQNNEAIQPGDQLMVTLDPGTLEAESAHSWSVSVDEEGQTSLPNIGSVKLAGLTRAQAEKKIVQTSLQRDVFLTPTVEVKLGERRQRQIRVSGAVESPGLVNISEDELSVADVIVRAGGITSEASGVITVSAAAGRMDDFSDPAIPNAVHSVAQRSVQAMTISLETTSESQLGQIMVPEGSAVNIEANLPRPIKVVGIIQNQVIEIPSGRNVRLLDAVTRAGGQTYSNWISDRVTVTRQVPGEDRTVQIRGSLRKARSDSAENFLLAPFDVVTVEENIITFTLSTLSGLVGTGVNAARVGL